MVRGLEIASLVTHCTDTLNVGSDSTGKEDIYPQTPKQVAKESKLKTRPEGRAVRSAVLVCVQLNSWK